MFSAVFYLVAVALSTLLETAVSVCPLTLHGKCLCDSINLVTNCSNANLTDLSILHDVPIQTKVLIFTGNNLNSLPIDAFGVDRKQPKPLLEMDLSSNNISSIHEKAFRGFDSLKKLILNNNNIVITGMFISTSLDMFCSSPTHWRVWLVKLFKW